MARNETREQKIEKKGGDVQVITEHSRTENARAEEVTAPMGVAPEKAGDRLVAVFFLHVVGRSVGRSVSQELARTERKGEEVRTSSRADGFWLTVSRDDVPRCRVERYGRQGNEKGCFGHVEKGTERHDFLKSWLRRQQVDAQYLDSQHALLPLPRFLQLPPPPPSFFGIQKPVLEIVG